MILEEKVKNFCLTGDYSIGKDILEQSYKLANTIVCNKYKNFGYTEDLLSESHDAIISAIYAFDPENKTKFFSKGYLHSVFASIFSSSMVNVWLIVSCGLIHSIFEFSSLGK